jgi:hypothetical protein
MTTDQTNARRWRPTSFLGRLEARKLEAQIRHTQAESFASMFDALKETLGLAAAREWAARELAGAMRPLDDLQGAAGARPRAARQHRRLKRGVADLAGLSGPWAGSEL